MAFLTEGDKVQIIGTSFNKGSYAIVVETRTLGAIVDILDFDYDSYKGDDEDDPASDWYYMYREMEFISHGE